MTIEQQFMSKFSVNIRALTKIASSIAADDPVQTENEIKKYKLCSYSPLKLYEAILQSYLFCGFPAAIESLKIFRNHYTGFSKSKFIYNVKSFKAKGKINCKLIYKKNYKKLIENMNYFSHDLKEWMIIEGYGKVMGRKGLTLLEREFINVSILCTRLYYNQLHSHIKGCLHLGASKEDINELLNSIKENVGRSNIDSAKELLGKLKP